MLVETMSHCWSMCGFVACETHDDPCGTQLSTCVENVDPTHDHVRHQPGWFGAGRLIAL